MGVVAGKVIVSHPTGNVNVSAVVSALFDEELLAAFYTCIAWRQDSAVARFTPRSVRSVFERRARVQLDPQFVRTRPVRELVRNLLIRAGKKHLIAAETNPFSIDGVYRDLDHFVARGMGKVPTIRALYAYEDGALLQFRQAHALGLHCFYDLPIGYWRANVKISSEEAELQPAWKGTLNALANSEAKCARKDEELALADTVIVPSTFVKNTLEMYPGGIQKIVVNPFGVPANISSARELTRSAACFVCWIAYATQGDRVSF
jgi:hypothetical protein